MMDLETLINRHMKLAVEHEELKKKYEELIYSHENLKEEYDSYRLSQKDSGRH
jgi:hypothetical protein